MAQVRGQQARAGEQDQHGGERLGRQDELRQREQAPDGEHVAAQDRDPERDRARPPPGAPHGFPQEHPVRPSLTTVGSPRSLRPNRAPLPPGGTRHLRSRARARRLRHSSAVRPHKPVVARCRNRATRPPRRDRGRRRPAPEQSGPVLSPRKSTMSRATCMGRSPPSHPAAAERCPRGSQRARSGTSRSTEPSSRRRDELHQPGRRSSPVQRSVPSTTEKAVKRMKSR